jgi:hypothetical protein
MCPILKDMEFLVCHLLRLANFEVHNLVKWVACCEWSYLSPSPLFLGSFDNFAFWLKSVCDLVLSVLYLELFVIFFFFLFVANKNKKLIQKSLSNYAAALYFCK